MSQPDLLLDTAEAASLLRVKPSTLEFWRRKGKGPITVKLVRAVRYRRTDLDAFLSASTVRPLGKAATILGGAA